MTEKLASENMSSTGAIPLHPVGIKEIDFQHARLVSEFERLRYWVAKGREFGAVFDAIEHLKSYVTEHMDYEEELLRQQNYPKLREHIVLHTYFRQELENLSRRLIEGNGNVSELVAFMKHWIIDHVGEADADYARYLSEETRTTPDQADDQWCREDDLKIDVAIAAHKAWRQRLEAAIDGHLNELPEVATIRDDTACVLGHCLYNCDQQLSNFTEHDNLLVTHREFHAVAGEIVRLCHAGETTSAKQLMAAEYSQLSDRIITLLKRMQDASKATTTR